MKRNYEQGVQLIPVNQVRVLNPRSRNRAKFQEMVNNITQVGLKRPITVSPRKDEAGESYYATGCGEGRLNAFQALGQTQIPALVIEADDEELLLISLTENLARRQCAGVEQMWEILHLKERSHKTADIARKVGLDVAYVSAILRLLKNGEERLVQAVVKRQMPIQIAISIATATDEEVQRSLQVAYEDKSLRGSQLLLVRKLISRRKSGGRKLRGENGQKTGKPTSNDLVQVYRKEATRQRALVTKAKLCETRLIFAINAVKALFEDEDFVTLLRAEGLNTMPKFLAQKIHAKGD